MTMTHPKTPQAMYDELAAKIEEIAPDAGFYMKGKPLDFTLEDVLSAILVWSGEGQLTFVSLPGVQNTLRLWRFGNSLSWHRDNAPETIAFLHSLLCR